MHNTINRLLFIFTLFTLSFATWADGTETLGPPGIPISTGTGVFAAGTGMVVQPANIQLNIPAGATVKQVLLYWEGQAVPPLVIDDTILVNGTEVTGAKIGGTTLFFGTTESTAFRADITGLNVVSAGNNSITLSGLEFNKVNNGAGIIAIIDDGGNPAHIDLRDGLDLAFINFVPPLDTTVVQTYTFDPEPVNRTANLAMFFSSVQPGDTVRPSAIEVIVGATTTVFNNELASKDGTEWDTFTASVDVPAGESKLSVQALSKDNLNTGELPASFAWIAGGLSLSVTPQEPLACRVTGGGVDSNLNWDYSLENGSMDRKSGVDRYQFGGQVGANTVLPPQPAGEWTHHQQSGPSGSFVFHGGTASAPAGTRIAEVECSDPGNCAPARTAPAKQIDFTGIGTFKTMGKGSRAPVFETDNAVVAAEGNGNKDFSGTYHWFEVNIDDLGEPGGSNSTPPHLCPSQGFGKHGAPVSPADCGCPDFYRITIYNGVYADPVSGEIVPNKQDVLYQVWGYIDGGNLQIHPPTGFDSK